MRRSRTRPKALKRGAKDRFTPSQVVEALRASGGIRHAAARMLGCSPSTITNYIERHPEIAEAAIEIQEESLDIAETVLIRNLKRDDAPNLQFKAITYYLRMKGKDRGYTTSETPSGKPKPRYDLSRLSPEEHRTLLELLNKARIK